MPYATCCHLQAEAIEILSALSRYRVLGPRFNAAGVARALAKLLPLPSLGIEGDDTSGMAAKTQGEGPSVGGASVPPIDMTPSITSPRDLELQKLVHYTTIKEVRQ